MVNISKVIFRIGAKYSWKLKRDHLSRDLVTPGYRYFVTNISLLHCVKSVRIRSFPGPYFPAFGLNMERYEVSPPYSFRIRENTDKKNSKYGHFSWSVIQYVMFLL